MVGGLQSHEGSLTDRLRMDVRLQAGRLRVAGKRAVQPAEVRRLLLVIRLLPELEGALEVGLAQRAPDEPHERLLPAVDRNQDAAANEEMLPLQHAEVVVDLALFAAIFGPHQLPGIRLVRTPVERNVRMIFPAGATVESDHLGHLPAALPITALRIRKTHSPA